MFTGRVLRVMVCSPSDVSAERAEIVKVIHQWTADSLVDEDVVLVPVLWEDMLPSTVEGVDGQTSINEMMTHKADIFIGVFKHRFGVEARAGAEVGTVEEIMIAMKAKKPLHLFFYNGPDTINQNNAGEVSQLAKVHEFKSSMQKHGIYAPYEKEHELKEKVLRALHADTKTFIRVNPLPSNVPVRIVDKPTDAPPVTGSKLQYSTQTATPRHLPDEATVGSIANPGLPTRRPVNSKGKPVRPIRPRFDNDLENQSQVKPGLPTRPPLSANSKPASATPRKSDDDHEKLRREQLHDYERAYNKGYTEDHSHLTASELHELENRETARKAQARFNGQDVVRYNAPTVDESDMERKRDIANGKNAETDYSPLTPVVTMTDGRLYISFKGSDRHTIKNLRVSITDFDDLENTSHMKVVDDFKVGEQLSLPFDLSKPVIQKKVIAVIWTIDGKEFSTRKRVF